MTSRSKKNGWMWSNDGAMIEAAAEAESRGATVSIPYPPRHTSSGPKQPKTKSSCRQSSRWLLCTELIQQCDIFSLFRQQQKNLLTNHNSWRARRGEIATFLIYRKSIWIVAAFPNGLSNTKTCIQNRKKGIVGTKASSSASPLLRTSSKGINYLARCRKLLYTLQL